MCWCAPEITIEAHRRGKSRVACQAVGEARPPKHAKRQRPIPTLNLPREIAGGTQLEAVRQHNSGKVNIHSPPVEGQHHHANGAQLWILMVPTYKQQLGTSQPFLRTGPQLAVQRPGFRRCSHVTILPQAGSPVWVMAREVGRPPRSARVDAETVKGTAY